MKDAEPSEFDHKVWKSPALNGSGHCCSHLAGLQQPGAGRTEPYPLWRGSELGETVESLADDDGHERHREVRIGGNKSVR